jgi:DNA-binding transcriptional regulator YiaG
MYAALSSQTAQATRFMASRSSAFEVASAKAIFFLYCAVGTMGHLTREVIEQRSATSNSGVQYEHVKVKFHQETGKSAVTIQPTSAEDIAIIRKVLKPAMLELANVFGVSRQTVYDWQSGTKPSAEAAAKLADLARAAEVFDASGVNANAQTLRRKVAGGGTLVDAVLNGGSAVQVSKLLVATLQRESDQRRMLSRQFANRKSNPIIDVSEYGTPSLTDNT